MKLYSSLFLMVFSVCLFAGDLADLKNTSEWTIRFPVKRHQTYKVIRYSQKDGLAAEISAAPNVFKYAELQLKEPALIADKQENFNGIISLRLKADNVNAFQAISVRIEDASGEVRQYRKTVKLRPGEFETIRIPVGWDVRPERIWGNRDKAINYPVNLTGLKFDYNPTETSVKLTVDDLKWELLKK